MPMPRATTLLLAALLLPTPAAMATNFPITAAQRETAQRVQQAGVAIADLAPDAPQRYVVKAGDTPMPLARTGLKRIASAGIPIIGVVLNQQDFKKAEQYYGEYSGYRKHGYGKPYGEVK